MIKFKCDDEHEPIKIEDLFVTLSADNFYVLVANVNFDIVHRFQLLGEHKLSKIQKVCICYKHIHEHGYERKYRYLDVTVVLFSGFELSARSLGGNLIENIVENYEEEYDKYNYKLFNGYFHKIPLKIRDIPFSFLEGSDCFFIFYVLKTYFESVTDIAIFIMKLILNVHVINFDNYETTLSRFR